MDTDKTIIVSMDAELLTNLAMLNSQELDPTGEVHDRLENGTMYPSKFKKVAEDQLPPVLKLENSKLNEIINVKGKVLYKYLRNYYGILKLIKQQIIKVYITPIVKFMISDNKYVRDFEKYFTYVEINYDDFANFRLRRNFIAKKYCDNGCIDLVGADGRITTPLSSKVIAESSILGLLLLTDDTEGLIHRNAQERDFQRVKGIIKVNVDNKLVFKSDAGKITVAEPMQTWNFLSRLEKYVLNSSETGRSTYITNPGINESCKSTFGYFQ